MGILQRIVAAGGLTLAVGCASEAQRAAVGDSAGAAPTTTPVSAAADSTTAPQVTARGIGPLRAGMTIAEARSALGGALAVPAGTDTAGCGYVQWRGGPPGVRVMIEGGRVARVDVDSVGVATSTGARVGDAESEVQRRYGGRAVVAPHKYEQGHYLTVIDPADTNHAIVFETRGGTVTRFRAGRRPQVEYVEGCG